MVASAGPSRVLVVRAQVWPSGGAAFGGFEFQDPIASGIHADEAASADPEELQERQPAPLACVRTKGTVDEAAADPARTAQIAGRVLSFMDTHLKAQRYLAGDAPTIADIACYPWIVLHERQGQDLNDFANLKRWFETIRTRPAVVRAYEIAKTINVGSAGMTEEGKKVLFGQGRRKKA